MFWVLNLCDHLRYEPCIGRPRWPPPFGHWRRAKRRSTRRAPIVFALFCLFSLVFDPKPRVWVHQAIAFAIASEFCRKLPFARNFRSKDEIFAISFAKPFAFASEFLRNAQFAAFCLRFGGKNSLANFRGASEFAFAFAVVSLRPRCTRGLFWSSSKFGREEWKK